HTTPPMSIKHAVPIACLLLACTCVVADETASTAVPPPFSPKDKLIVETVLRLKSFDVESSHPAKEALIRYLRAQPGTPPYFELLERFKLAEMADDLLEFSLSHSEQSNGVRAAKILFSMEREA